MRKELLGFLYKSHAFLSIKEFLLTRSDEELNELTLIINSMINDNLIRVSGKVEEFYHQDNLNAVRASLRSYKTLFAQITKEGRTEWETFLRDEQQRIMIESVIKTNESVAKTNESILELNRFQKFMAWLTVLIAILATFFAAIPVFTNNSTTIKNLEPLLQRQEEMIRAIKNIKVQISNSDTTKR